MRWLKHMTATRRDEQVSRFIGAEASYRGRLARYGFWWSVLEVVAEQIKPGESKNSATYSPQQWSALLGYTPTRVCKQLLNYLASCSLIVLREVGSDWEVQVPNLLKYRDEYSRTVKYRTELLRSDSVAKIQIQSQRQRTPPTPLAGGSESAPGKLRSNSVAKDLNYSPEFEQFWALYPRQVGKPKAWRAWQKQVQPSDAPKILEALKVMIPSVEWQRERGRFIPFPGTFIYERRWEDRNI